MKSLILSLTVILIMLSACINESKPKTVYYKSTRPELEHCNNKLTPKERDVCYQQTAMKANSDALCDEVNEVELKNACYLEVARDTSNQYICQKIIKDDDVYTKCMTSSTDDYY